MNDYKLSYHKSDDEEYYKNPNASLQKNMEKLGEPFMQK